jgi:hypothetical protein
MQTDPITPQPFLRAASAGAIFGVGLFCVGFILGVPRTLFLAPWIGKQAAILVELPIMVIFAWLLGAYLMKVWMIGTGWPARAQVTACAFLVGMALEVALGMTLQGQTAFYIVTQFVAPENRFALLGQLLVFAIPLFQSWAVGK